jgi:hypothetical protein
MRRGGNRRAGDRGRHEHHQDHPVRHRAEPTRKSGARQRRCRSTRWKHSPGTGLQPTSWPSHFIFLSGPQARPILLFLGRPVCGFISRRRRIAPTMSTANMPPTTITRPTHSPNDARSSPSALASTDSTHRVPRSTMSATETIFEDHRDLRPGRREPHPAGRMGRRPAGRPAVAGPRGRLPGPGLPACRRSFPGARTARSSGTPCRRP